MKLNPSSPAAYWLWLAIVSMIFMGTYAFLVALSRAPGFNLMFTDQNFFKTALVTHVVLSVVIWFLAYILFAIYHTTSLDNTTAIDYIPVIGAFIGVALIVATPFTGPAYPTLNNYVPVLNRELYFIGLIMFFGSVSIGILRRLDFLWRQSKIYSGYPVIISGSLFAAGVCVIVAILLMIIAYVELESANVTKGPMYFEVLFWGGGHILQFANTLAVMAVWALLCKHAYAQMPIKDRYAAPVLILTTLAVLLAPAESLFNAAMSPDSRLFFLELKRWGAALGPIAIGFGIIGLYNRPTLDKIASRGLWVSLGLFALGGLISLTIHGQDTRVPAHYHGVIGSVTLCFMTYAMVTCIQNGWLSDRSTWKTLQINLYGLGQGLFVTGLFIGGYAGLPRKTFGVAQNLDNAIKYTGMGIMGIGGLMAVAGGALFVILMIKAFTMSRRSEL